MDLGSSIRRRRKPSRRAKREGPEHSGERATGAWWSRLWRRRGRGRLPWTWRDPGPGGPLRRWRRRVTDPDPEEGPASTGRDWKGAAHDGLRSLGAAVVAGARRPSGLAERPWLIALLVMGVGLSAGYLVATTFFFRPPAPPPELQGVPEVRGQTLGLATVALADLGLEVGRVDSIRHPEIPEGIVIGQSPLPGRTSLPAASVRVTVSLGPEVRPVPDVTRLPGSRAAALLEESGFVVAVDTVESAAPAGQVIQIEPVPGTPVAIPGDVRVAVSLGPPTVPMPALAGLNRTAAVNLLSALGLVVSEIDYRYSLLNVDLVFGQYPGPLTRVEQGSEVRLIIGQRVRAPFGTFFRRRPAQSREQGVRGSPRECCDDSFRELLEEESG